MNLLQKEFRGGIRKNLVRIVGATLATKISCPILYRVDNLNQGEVAERPIAPVLKTDVPRGTGGSNPPLSAYLNAVES